MWLWWLILHVNLMRDAKRCMNNWLNIISGCVWGGSGRDQHVNCWTHRSRRPFSVGGRHPSRWGLSRGRRGGRLNAHSTCMYEGWHRPSAPRMYKVWHWPSAPRVYEGWHDRLPLRVWGLALTICPWVYEVWHWLSALCVYEVWHWPSAPCVYEVWHWLTAFCVYEVWHWPSAPAVLVLRPPHWTALYTMDPLSFWSLNYTTSFPGSLSRR